MSPRGRHRVQLTQGPADDAFPNYSPNGKRIVFTRGAAGSAGVGQAWIMNQDGSGQKQLTHGSPTVESTTFSPNGKRIAFTRGDGGSTQLWTMKVDGTDQTQLTFPGPSGDHVHGPTYSPDGHLIAFSHHYGPADYHGISVIKPNGTGEKALTMPSAATDDFQPDFSPNGKRIVFDRYNQVQDDLYVIKTNGSGLRALTNTSDLDLSPAFSPNGKKVIFERDNTDLHGCQHRRRRFTRPEPTRHPAHDERSAGTGLRAGLAVAHPPSLNLSGEANSQAGENDPREGLRESPFETADASLPRFSATHVTCSVRMRLREAPSPMTA